MYMLISSGGMNCNEFCVNALSEVSFHISFSVTLYSQKVYKLPGPAHKTSQLLGHLGQLVITLMQSAMMCFGDASELFNNW